MKPLTPADERAIAQRATRIASGDIGRYTAAYEQSRRDVLRLLDEVRRLRVVSEKEINTILALMDEVKRLEAGRC